MQLSPNKKDKTNLGKMNLINLMIQGFFFKKKSSKTYGFESKYWLRTALTVKLRW